MRLNITWKPLCFRNIFKQVAAGILSLFLIVGLNSQSRSESLPPAVFQSPGIILDETGFNGNHPFQIITAPGANYFVKLVDNATGANKIGVFVKGGQGIEVTVPAGQYRMRYATGDTWRGIQHLFGPGKMTSYQESSDILNFNESGGYYNGYTVELILQTDGNMDTHSIPASSF